MRSRLLPKLIAALCTLFVAGCSSQPTGPQRQVRDTDGMVVELSVRPGLPQDQGQSSAGGAIAGDNTLIVKLSNDHNSAPITDANVSAAPSNTLVGSQRPESGRAQGNGVYFVPIRFGVPDTYAVTVTIDRTGRPEAEAHFKIMAG